MASHEKLIDELCGGALPVRRVSPAWMRALAWIPVALLLGFLSTRMLHRVTLEWSAPHAGVALANIALSLALGAGALACALTVSVAGDPAPLRRWMTPAFAAWLACAAVGIASSSRPAGNLGQGSYCLTFILVAGLPMIGIVVLALRRTRSLLPVRSLTLAGTGVGFLSFGLLGFCHPVTMSAVDFAMHLVGAVILGGATILLGRDAVAA